MQPVPIPLDLFQALAGYLIPRMSDPRAEGLYNGLVVAMHTANTAAEADGKREYVDGGKAQANETV